MSGTFTPLLSDALPDGLSERKDPFDPTTGEVVGARFQNAWDALPVVRFLRNQQAFNESGEPAIAQDHWKNFHSQNDGDALEQQSITAERGPAPQQNLIDPDVANQQVKDAGVPLTPYTQPVPEAQLRSSLNTAVQKKTSDDIIARRANGILTSSITGFGIDLLVSLADPIQTAAYFLPVVPEAFMGEKIASIVGRGVGATLTDRVAARVATGAAEGAAGQTLLEPVNMGLSRQDHEDWTVGEALSRIAFNAAGGAVLHTGLGALFGHVPVEGRTGAFKAALSQEIADKPVDVADILNFSEAKAPPARRPLEDAPLAGDKARRFDIYRNAAAKRLDGEDTPRSLADVATVEDARRVLNEANVSRSAPPIPDKDLGDIFPRLSKEGARGFVAGHPDIPDQTFRGAGREGQTSVYSGPATPIMGEGRYSAFNEDAAKTFGPEVSRGRVELNNPLVIRNDEQWRALTREAGWEYPNLSGADEAKAAKATEALKATVTGKGHDGVIAYWDDSITGDINPKTGDSVKLLRDVLDKPQVVDYRGKSAEGAETSAAIADEAAKNMARRALGSQERPRTTSARGANDALLRDTPDFDGTVAQQAAALEKEAAGMEAQFRAEVEAGRATDRESPEGLDARLTELDGDGKAFQAAVSCIASKGA